MTPEMRIWLMKEQKRVIHSMRQHHEACGVSADAITLIVSTSGYKSSGEGNIKTHVILVEGVINGANTLTGNEAHGWILSLSWMYSREIRKKLRESWLKRIKRPQIKAWPAFSKMSDVEKLDLNFEGPSKNTKKGGIVEAFLESEGLAVRSLGGQKYILENKIMHMEEELAAFSFIDEVNIKSLKMCMYSHSHSLIHSV